MELDRISMLPDELRQLILTHLSLKEAIRTGVLARGWRNLWKTRWPHLSSVEVHLRPRENLRKKLDELKGEPRDRLDRFSFIVDVSKNSSELRPFLRYAADCGVEDLHVETRKTSVEKNFNFHLPGSSPRLTRLSLRRMGISNIYSDSPEFRALEIIRLHNVSMSKRTFSNVVALCPNLRTLDLRYCDCDCIFHIGNHMPSLKLTNLRSLTVARCYGRTSLNAPAVAAPSLRSFRYNGDFLRAPFHLPSDAALADLYICFSCPIPRSRFYEALPDDLSDLTVLTLCSNALSILSPSWDSGATAQLPKLCNLHNLRELQLLMLNMAAANLADIYAFLMTCQCVNLERLFVHLPVLNCNPIAASHDEVGELPLLEIGLGNLKIVKFMNFKCHCNEVQLLRFLLRKATSLQKVLLVSPMFALLDMPSLQQARRLLVQEALANYRIIFSKSDDNATQPYHSEVFI